MRYAEISDGRARFVLPAEIAGAYLTMPPNAVEIALDADVTEGDIYEDGVFRKPTAEDMDAGAMADFRGMRDAIFEVTRWVRERHTDRVDMGIDDEASWDAWLNYWQALRDLPDTEGFNPAAPVWPEKPE